MSAKGQVKQYIKQIVRSTPILKDYAYGVRLYKKYRRSGSGQSLAGFLLRNGPHFYKGVPRDSKAEQIADLIRRLEIRPADNDSFFYSLDCYKTLRCIYNVYGNTTADIALLVNGRLGGPGPVAEDNRFAREQGIVLDALRSYLERCKKTPGVGDRYEKQLAAAGSIFDRPAGSFFEALQRILFYNQFLWQTGHTLNGLGHLDWILERLYQGDIEAGVLTREKAKKLLKDFFRVLHENYWFKSAVLMGDTGQIVILGGRTAEGGYRCNDLTYLFIEVSEELRLPDPKVLLRCAADMPEELLDSAVKCIATGIGAPLLSNDEAVIPAMLSYGYEAVDVYQYGTSACWEPLVPGISCEANNAGLLNFAVPFTEMMDTPGVFGSSSAEELLERYEEHLAKYIDGLLTPLEELVFEEDPLLSMACPSALASRKDITRGGAKYNSIGVTSVGLGSVVNSFLNIQKLVFEEKRYTLQQLDALRRRNFDGHDELLDELRALTPCFGCDAQPVLDLTKRILSFTGGAFGGYKTKYGGGFKFGLSSPSYIDGGTQAPATFDGRRNGEPFSVHISSASAIPTTELLSFAMQMDYNGNRLNGNVIDFITSPGLLRSNLEKYSALLRGGIIGGIFQLQMNVVDSKTLIAAKKDPTLFPDLVVRVWGFSAYFNDLPEAYKDVLIARAVESEKAA